MHTSNVFFLLKKPIKFPKTLFVFNIKCYQKNLLFVHKNNCSKLHICAQFGPLNKTEVYFFLPKRIEYDTKHKTQVQITVRLH